MLKRLAAPNATSFRSGNAFAEFDRKMASNKLTTKPSANRARVKYAFTTSLQRSIRDHDQDKDKTLPIVYRMYYNG